MRVIEASRDIPVEKDPDTDAEAAKVMSRKEMLAAMKYAKVIQPSGRIDIMDPYVPEGTPPVLSLDEDLPEPTNESDEEDVTADVTANEILSKDEQAYIDQIDKDQVRDDLESMYTSSRLDLEQLEIDNYEVIGQFPRGTHQEPMADPGEPQEVEESWAHRILTAVRTLPESESWTVTSTAEPSSTTSSGEASTSTDSGHADSDVRASSSRKESTDSGDVRDSSSRKEMASSSRQEIRQNTKSIGSLHN